MFKDWCNLLVMRARCFLSGYLLNQQTGIAYVLRQADTAGVRSGSLRVLLKPVVIATCRDGAVHHLQGPKEFVLNMHAFRAGRSYAGAQINCFKP